MKTLKKSTVSRSSRKTNKKRKPQKKKMLWKVPLIASVLLILGSGFIYFRTARTLRQMGLDVNPVEVLQFIIKGGLDSVNAQKADDKGNIGEDKEIPEVKKDSSGRYTNMLIAGIDTRESKKTLMNTDSVIIATYDHQQNKIIMFSIPRDTVIQMPNAFYQDSKKHYNKINSVYGIGENKRKGSGLGYLEEAIEQTYDMQIQYAALVNYEGFIQIIDLLGGVEVEVENTFTDYKYPSSSRGTMKVHFDKGIQTMNGETALKYARSRKSLDNGEGSDYARARRQQNLIKAIKQKASKSANFSSLSKILDLLQILEKNLQFSNYSMEDIKGAYALLDTIQKAEVHSFVLDPSTADYSLITTGITSGYSIGPKAGLGNYEKISEYVKKAQQYPELYSANPKIYIYNYGDQKSTAKQYTAQIENEFPHLTVYYVNKSKNLNVTKWHVLTVENLQNKNAIGIYLSDYINEELDKEISNNTDNTVINSLKGDVKILIAPENKSETN